MQHLRNQRKMTSYAKSMIQYELPGGVCRKARQSAIAIADKRSTYRQRSSDWSAGQFKEPWHSVAVGLLGECAFYGIFRSWFNDLPTVNLSVSRLPSMTDFTYQGKRIEIKTSTSELHNLVRQDHLKRCDLIGFCYASLNDCIGTGVATVTFKGWHCAGDVPIVGSKKRGKGKWENYTLQNNDLATASDLLAYLKGLGK